MTKQEKEVSIHKKFKIDKKDIHTHKLSPMLDKILKYQRFDEDNIESIDVEEIPNQVIFIKMKFKEFVDKK